MVVAYNLSEQEAVDAMKLNGRGSNKTLFILSVLGFALLLAGIFTQYKVLALGGLAGGVAGYFITVQLVIPRNARKQYRLHKALRDEIKMQSSDQGIVFSSESGESRLTWEHILKWKLGRSICLIYIAPNMFHIVPLRAFAQQANTQELITLLEQHVGQQAT